MTDTKEDLLRQALLRFDEAKELLADSDRELAAAREECARVRAEIAKLDSIVASIMDACATAPRESIKPQGGLSN